MWTRLQTDCFYVALLLALMAAQHIIALLPKPKRRPRIKRCPYRG